MSLKNAIRCLLLLGAFASMGAALGGCHHTQAREAINRNFHNR